MGEGEDLLHASHLKHGKRCTERYVAGDNYKGGSNFLCERQRYKGFKASLISIARRDWRLKGWIWEGHRVPKGRLED